MMKHRNLARRLSSMLRIFRNFWFLRYEVKGCADLQDKKKWLENHQMSDLLTMNLVLQMSQKSVLETISQCSMHDLWYIPVVPLQINIQAVYDFWVVYS